MSFYKRDLLNHFKAIQPALLELGAEAFLDPSTFVLRARLGAATRTLYPQFISFAKGLKQYTPSLNADARRFIGWCPYVNRRWVLASQKLAFKQFAVENSIRTPDYSTDSAAEMEDVVVKRSVSSFGSTIKGPFKRSSEHSLDVQTQEYFERFTFGRIAKIWYWNDRPVCVEFERMPIVEGNGIATMRELIERRLRRRKKRAMEKLEPLLDYQNVTLDTVLPKAQERIIDFRYGSPFARRRHERDVDLVNEMIPSLEPQLRAFGSKLWRGIPDQLREDTVFTVDAIVDERDRIWALEMNSNPFIHPYVYPVMLKDLFTAKKPNLAGAALQT